MDCTQRVKKKRKQVQSLEFCLEQLSGRHPLTALRRVSSSGKPAERQGVHSSSFAHMKSGVCHTATWNCQRDTRKCESGVPERGQSWDRSSVYGEPHLVLEMEGGGLCFSLTVLSGFRGGGWDIEASSVDLVSKRRRRSEVKNLFYHESILSSSSTLHPRDK